MVAGGGAVFQHHYREAAECLKGTRITRITRIMDAKDILTIEDYKKRISDLIDELEKEIGIKIQNVDITPKVGLMNIRGVKFNIEL